MGRKRPEKGRRRGTGRRPAAPRDARRSDAAGNRAVAGAGAGNGGGPPGPSRLLLTRLVREGAIWDVYIATIPQGGASNLTQLQFEGTGAEQEKLRYTRPLAGSLLAALHSGAPVVRASLAEELDLAFRDAVAVDDADAVNPLPTEPPALPQTTY